MLLYITVNASEIDPLLWISRTASVANARIMLSDYYDARPRLCAHAAVLLFSATIMLASACSLHLFRVLEHLEKQHGVRVAPVMCSFGHFFPTEGPNLSANAII